MRDMFLGSKSPGSAFFFDGRGRALLGGVIRSDGRGLIVGSFQSFHWWLLSRTACCSSQLRQGGGYSFPGC
jgi:hypothetical protein